MRLFEGSVADFSKYTSKNQIADIVADKYVDYYGRRPGPSEYRSWNNSLQFLKSALTENISNDCGIIIEYELPYCNDRIDCLVFGQDVYGKANVVVIELKQWESVQSSEIENNVITFTGGAMREVAHPSYQVKMYQYYLEDFLEVFHEENASLSSCVYCHNYSRKREKTLFNDQFEIILKEHPIFAKEDFENLGQYLKKRLSSGKGLEILEIFNRSKVKPSKKLIDITKETINGQKTFFLLDEQIAANNAIIDRAKNCGRLKNKSVIIIQGGPGTGKSVIALNALSELLSKGMTVFHATGSSAFTKTMRKIVGARSSHLFKYFNSFAQHTKNSIDIIICDEAHRIRKSSNNRYTKAELRSDKPQIEEILNVAKVSIFFVDDHQVVRPEEIGSSSYIEEYAKKNGATVHKFELTTQFRCNGSNGYINWIDTTLGIKETPNRILTKNEKIVFKIFDSPKELQDAIYKKNNAKPNSARLVAGFCWAWSDPLPNGTLVKDIKIGNFEATWEAKKPVKGAPEAALWAYDPRGVEQFGSVYTIQGFEFDYVGIIFGPDLLFDPEKKDWVAVKENSADPMLRRAKKEEFIKYVKNVYRVLFTRGMKGIYVYFVDKNTEEFFRSRIQLY